MFIHKWNAKMLVCLLVAQVWGKTNTNATTTFTVGASGASYTTIAAAYAACTAATDYM
jgi:hypothetical protein